MHGSPLTEVCHNPFWGVIAPFLFFKDTVPSSLERYSTSLSLLFGLHTCKQLHPSQGVSRHFQMRRIFSFVKVCSSRRFSRASQAEMSVLSGRLFQSYKLDSMPLNPHVWLRRLTGS